MILSGIKSSQPFRLYIVLLIYYIVWMFTYICSSLCVYSLSEWDTNAHTHTHTRTKDFWWVYSICTYNVPTYIELAPHVNINKTKKKLINMSYKYNYYIAFRIHIYIYIYVYLGICCIYTMYVPIYLYFILINIYSVSQCTFIYYYTSCDSRGNGSEVPSLSLYYWFSWVFPIVNIIIIIYNAVITSINQTACIYIICMYNVCMYR